MNITLVLTKFKSFETTFCPLSQEEFEELRLAGIVAKKKRIYHMVLNYRDIQVECPVQLDGKKPIGIILPAFKLPYRRYPVYTYLYAVAMYLSGESMRSSARKTAEKFGLPKFSHSTISRTFGALVIKVDEIAAISPLESGLLQSLAPSSYEKLANLTEQPSLVVRPRWKETYKQAALRLFNVLLSLFSSPENGSILAYQYFIQYGCLLL